MKFPYKMESVLITITAILCTILLLKLLLHLRSAVPWRVNCWFCNCNSWVKFPVRNCWICPKCEQYNGFTKDGDYNRKLNITAEPGKKSPNVFQKTPPKNGLCKMCNINQQLKVAQLANFVPMNDRKFDEEIEFYRLQLEKAYKLCTPCKKVLQTKLHKEKETFLGSKLLEARTPERKQQRQQAKQSQILRNLVNGSSTIIAGILFVLVTLELWHSVNKHKNVLKTMHNIQDIIVNLFDRIFTIIKIKTFMTFPYLENIFYDMNIIENLGWFKNLTTGHLTNFNESTQKALGSFVCFVQIVGHVWNINQLNYSILIDLLWAVFAATSIAHESVSLHPLLMIVIKLSSVLAVILVYRKMKSKTGRAYLRIPTMPKNVKNIGNGTIHSLIDDEADSLSLDTDDDVSLSKFGLHNFTDSSNETLSPLNKSLSNGRSFTPRTESVWGKPKLNSTFCVNSVVSNSPSSVSDTVFIKPSFNKYQNLAKSDSDSELDESISSLCIGPKSRNVKSNPVFGLRKFNPNPCFAVPTSVNGCRPLISPSKLGGTSWVAGGYWGSEGERQIFNINGSRSSSQSSGFESQASSLNQRNLFSQPPSREDSVCGDPERNSFFDRFQSSNASNYGFQNGTSFAPISSPVFPQMQYNSHVQIPRPRFAQTFASQNVFAQQQPFPHNGMFKTPGGSGLIKLPQDSFMPR